jgi:TatD DNase family protein
MFSKPESIRILLETDGPYMVPANIYATLATMKGKLPLCHSAMIPWTAQFVAEIAGNGWNSEKILHLAGENAKKVYGLSTEA